jgi:hypothetical protein
MTLAKGISMRRAPTWLAIGLFMFAANYAHSQEAARLPPPDSPVFHPDPSWIGAQTGGPPEQKNDAQAPPAANQPQPTDAAAQGPAPGGEAPAGPNPRMIGDKPGYSVLKFTTATTTQTINTFQNVTTTKTVPQTTIQPIQQTFVGPVTQITTINGGVDIIRGPVIVTGQGPVTTLVNVPVTVQVPKTIQQPTTVTVMTRVPLASAGAFSIAENQSPMPEDRAYFTYNYYNDLHGPAGAFAASHSDIQHTTLDGFPATVTTVIPGIAPVHADLHREVFGLEKTFLDGDASIGLRVPLFQTLGDGTFNQHDLGDVSVLLNFAFYRDRASGNVISGGLLVTTPTGPSVDSIDGDIHPVLLQPFVGGRWDFDSWFIQGFSSVAVPTDGREVTALFNDFGVGYWVYRGGSGQFLSAVIPTLEAHITTPVNHRGANDPITVPDIVDLTAGLHFGLGQRSMLTFGVVAPVTGPPPFAVEALVQFNVQY